ncbi:ornithine cyclodeaminase family protein [Lacisediminimonas profundi]|uniref:ornithine cyclodeaminase family protein n=1 Tax=Lacisediminimonas profundi TaxID=2603856 RepID=UPI0019D5625C|nr:ornithine cyclodeaminase family protein [Lacisediminimonas profundi]
MIPYLNAAQLRTALPYPALIDALRDAFLQGAVAPTRHVHRVDEKEGTVLLLMPVWQEQAHMGVKLVTVAPGNPARGLSTVHSIFVLFDTASGEPKALLDGEELTLRRTAAASALASRWLSRPDSRTLLVVGTGSLARYMAPAHCAQRPIERVLVWGRNGERARATAAAIREQGLPANIELDVATDLAEAAASADIITAATTSTTPLLKRKWISPGTHVDLVGGFKPDMREADDDLMAAASLFVDTFAGALAEAGDLRQPMENGRLQRSAVLAEMADLVHGRHPGRREAAEITLFKSVGTGIEDLAAANLAWSVLRPAG